MVTLKEIAKECRVSPATVSNILNGKPKVSEETRQRVLDTVEKRGVQAQLYRSGTEKPENQDNWDYSGGYCTVYNTGNSGWNYEPL
ncbi:MAG: LacI family DNA-binding transcriptional regulator [Lachnospiraceae bacterium]|nr:LacI family DNA-binding transcriptional regulator [Lachnospiraceae bacterium]